MVPPWPVYTVHRTARDNKIQPVVITMYSACSYHSYSCMEIVTALKMWLFDLPVHTGKLVADHNYVEQQWFTY